MILLFWFICLVPPLRLLLSMCTSLSCYYAPTIEDLKVALDKYHFCGILALSPMDSSGLAYEAIDLFRNKFGNSGLVIYHGWDFRFEISAPRALKCQADALLIGAMEDSKFFPISFDSVEVKERG